METRYQGRWESLMMADHCCLLKRVCHRCDEPGRRTRKKQFMPCIKKVKVYAWSFRRRRLKGIHSRSDTNRTGAEGLSFYYPRLLHCLDQMLAVMLLSQHRVSSSKTVRPRALCGARCIGHAVSTWSAFALRRHTCNLVKERDPICAWTNGIAQHQSAGG